MVTDKGVALSAMAHQVAKRVRCLRDFLDLLSEHAQYVQWPDAVLPEPDIRHIAVAAGNDPGGGPAILFDRIRGYPGKRLAVNVHGSFANLAILMGQPKTATVRELFFDLIKRWGSDQPLLEWVATDQAPIFENVREKDFNLYELLPLHRINASDGGFYIGKACVVSRDPLDPDEFGKQNVGIYRIQPMGGDTFTLLSIPSHDMGRHIMAVLSR